MKDKKLYKPPRGQTRQEVDRLFMNNSHIGGRTGISLEAARDQGLIPEDVEGLSIASSALSGTVSEILEIDYPDDIAIHDPSDETVKFWPEEFRYQYTSDGTRWLCAIDSNDKVFAKVEATSNINANNTAMLLEAVQPILNHFRSVKGQQSLGLEKPKDIAA